MVDFNHRDTVAPFAFGYYTPFWFSDGGWPQTPGVGELTMAGSLLCQAELSNGIQAGAFENGLLVFDFSNCSETPVVVHRESLWNEIEPDEKGGRTDTTGKISKQLSRSRRRQRLNQSYYRTVLLSHALLFENACRLVSGTGFQLSRIEKIHDALSGHGIHKMRPRSEISKSSVLRKSLATIDRSFQDLDFAIKKGSFVLRALELHKLSHYRLLDQRFSESLVLSWTVCESLIDFVWQAMMDDISSKQSARMTNRRKDVLRNPTAFTASVRLETLELSGYLSLEAINDLNAVRKKRNDWLHSLKDVDEDESLHSIKTCARLIQLILGIEIHETIVSGSGGEGGGMFVDVFQKRFPNFDLAKHGYP